MPALHAEACATSPQKLHGRRPLRWNLAASDDAAVAALARELSLAAPAARVLWSRGYRTPEDARRFLTPAIADLHDPYLLAGMHAAVSRLRASIESREDVQLL